MRGVLAAGVPLFGICLGSQILGRALGLGTYKLRFGHRGVNQPVQDLRTGQVQITSHNHGFAVAMPAAAPPWRRRAGAGRFDTELRAVPQMTHVNLNDGVVEGLRLLDAPGVRGAVPPRGGARARTTRPACSSEFCELMEREPDDGRDADCDRRPVREGPSMPTRGLT